MLATFLLLWLLTALSPGLRPALAAPFVVNSYVDTNDADTGNPACADSDGNCSLRAAIQQAVALAGADTITLPAGTYPLTLGALAANGGDSLTLNGAAARSTIINQTTPNSRVFDIFGSAVVEINQVTISGGSLTADYGAGVWVNASAQVTLNNTIITGNNGFEGGGLGTGLFSTVTLNQVEISGNVATTGGGIYVVGGSLTLNNATVSGNSATNNGGGIYQSKPPLFASTVSFNHVTLASNTADSDNTGGGSGGGVHKNSGTFNFMNTIIADNSVGTSGSSPDCFGPITSQDYNLIENVTGCTIGGTTTNNLPAGTDPALGALANNGGATDTHSIGVGSPAVDKIPSSTNGCTTTYTDDQRGVERADGAASGTSCDMGACEFTSAPAAIVLRTVIARGSSSGPGWSEALAIASILLLTLSGAGLNKLPNRSD